MQQKTYITPRMSEYFERFEQYSTLISTKRDSIFYDRQDRMYPGSTVTWETHHIRRNYKFLKRQMEPNAIVDYLVEHNILTTDENSFLIGKRRAIKCDIILLKLLQYPKLLPKFTTMIKCHPQEEGFRCFLSLPPSEVVTRENPDVVEKVSNSTCLDKALQKNEDELLGEISSRISSESGSIVDDFLEKDVLSVDDHREISEISEINKTKAAILILESISNKLPGSYLKVLSILKSHNLNDLAGRLLKQIENNDLEQTENKEQLNVKFVGGDVHVSTKAPKMEIAKIKMIITSDTGNERVLEKVLKEIPNAEEMFAQGTHSTFDKTLLGSIIIVLQTESSYAMEKLKHFIEKEGISKFLGQLFESRDVRTLLTKGKYNIEVLIREAQEPIDPDFYILQSTERRTSESTYKSCLERCHSFLLEELEPSCLLKDQEVANIFGSVLEKVNQPDLRTTKVESFLEYLKNQSEEKIKVVVEKLKEKNKYIYDQMFPDTAKFQDIDNEQVKGNILDSLPELLDIVSIRTIQTPLLSTGVISSEDLDFIHKNSGSFRKETMQFVKLVLHRGAEAIKVFLSALEISCGESTVQNLLQPRDVQMTSANEGGHAKIDYKAFNEESGLLFKGRFVLELKTEAVCEKQDEGPKKNENMETLSENHLQSLSVYIAKNLDEAKMAGTPVSTQHYIECATCHNYSRFYCNDCHLRMCEQCRENHLKQNGYNNHEIVLYEVRNKQLPIAEKCKTHPKKDVDLYCNDCKIPVCSNCFASYHNGHKMVILEVAYNDCFKACHQELLKISDILPKALRRLETQRESEKDVKEEIVNLRQSLNKRAQEIKETVDIILTENYTKLGELEDVALKETETQKTKIQDFISSLEQLKKDYDNSLSYKPSDLIAFHKKMTPLYVKEMPETVKPVLPVFSKGTLLKGDMEKMFGEVIVPKPLDEEYESEEKSVRKSFQPDVKRERKLNIPNPSFHLSSVSLEKFWTSDSWGDLFQCDVNGNTLQKISTHIKDTIGYHTVTTEGSLLYTDYKKKEIFKVTNDMINKIITTGEWEPRSIHSSHINGDILVGMKKNKEWKVIKYNKNGRKLQDIQRDDKGGNLYKSVHYITENINGDICSSDYDTRRVVVVTKSGQYQFSYSGHEFQSGFCPYGICTDMLGHILVCNGYSAWFKNFSSVHLLDLDGQFLSILLTPDQCPGNPRALCIDNEQHLMVGSGDSSTVTVYKYIQNKDS